MKALVTGGGGFLGRAIVELLVSRGDRVRVLARNRYPDVEALGAECVQGDIRSEPDCVGACMGMDAVFHAAALPGIWGDRKLFHAINVQGTRHIIDACKRRGVPKLIFTSSPSVVFDMKDECGINEDTPYPQRFYNIYSQTKAHAESIVLENSGRDGLQACALRPHLIWGPRDNHLLPRLIERALKKKLRIVGRGENKVDLTYVENAAAAHLLASDAMTPKRVAGQAYFISDGQPVELWPWINEFLKRVSVEPAKKRAPVALAYAAGFCFENLFWLIRRRKEPPMTRFLSKALSCSHYYDISKARRDFGYRPIVSNDEGLRRTAEYFKKNVPKEK
ncbi:MAG TPA: NAD-dependent epimerase/dehydratase family protein [Planctomycetota bacterium]|nr:NAD-dependent epimerase/dehydratase family protein [Planctomycetota bacterium]